MALTIEKCYPYTAGHQRLVKKLSESDFLRAHQIYPIATKMILLVPGPEYISNPR